MLFLQYTYRFTVWPALLGSLFLLHSIITSMLPHSNMAFSIAYMCAIAGLYVLERFHPQVPEWLSDDGQSINDVLLTLISKTFSYAFLQINLVLFAVQKLSDSQLGARIAGWGLWPHQWPYTVQIAAGLLMCELFFYWYHRLAHEFKPLWCFHAVHHFPKRLWVLNTGRSHIVDSTLFMAGIIPLVALGASRELISDLLIITAFIGLLSHANIAVPMGPWRYVFNGADNHRWHHSVKMDEGNRNYGQNLMVWDHIFGSYYQDPSRMRPKRIGSSLKLPKDLIGQLREPVAAFRKSLSQPLWYK
ncbi:MAG: sterol desaturase family protein [Proteobacteria bacterium]|nr:sterol desaturase family protein [Pseudomonadota bacterium]